MHNARLIWSCKGPETAMASRISIPPPLARRRTGAKLRAAGHGRG